MCTINEDYMIYGSWDIRHDWQMEIPVSHEDIIILQMSIKNHDHMLYCSWDIVHDSCNCFLFFFEGGIFCHFTLVTAQKSWSYDMLYHPRDMTHNHVVFDFRLFLVLLFPNSPKNKKKWKHHLEISSLTPVPKIMIRWGTVPEI